tara:strand:- start:793 stop:969 length:177 start_codon:yes stop_codon:yes gene_type:complete
MIHLQVQKKDIPSGQIKVLFDIETEKSGKTFMTNELQLMYEDQATETVEISVVEISAS